jgi:hypothetical protein
MKSTIRSPGEITSQRDTSGDTRVPTTERAAKPRLPHERDASSDSQTPVPGPVDDIGAQAHEDLQRGLRDTDRGPVIDEVYRKSVKPAAPRRPPRS